MKFSTPHFFKRIDRGEKSLTRLFTGRKSLAVLNLFSFLYFAASLGVMAYHSPEILNGNLKTVLLLAITTFGLNTFYFIYTWQVSRHRVSLDKCWDPLTGAWSHSYFEGLMQEEIARAGRYHHPLCLCLLDLDNFASYNSSYGKKNADELLKKFSTFLRGSIRTSDILGRYDNDSFFLLLPHTDIVRAEKVVSRLWEHAVDSFDCSFRAGITAYSVGEKKSQFKTRAKSALEHAKKAGNKRILCLVGQHEDQVVLEF